MCLAYDRWATAAMWQDRNLAAGAPNWPNSSTIRSLQSTAAAEACRSRARNLTGPCGTFARGSHWFRGREGLIMGELRDLWKCETCEGWFELGRCLDRGRPLPTASECSCPAPNIQQRFISQDLRAMNAIDRVVQECESVLADARELRPEVWAIIG